MKTLRNELLRQRLERLGIVLTRGLRDQRTCWMLEKEDPTLGHSWQLSASNRDDVETLVQKLEQQHAHGGPANTYTFGIARPSEAGTAVIVTATTTTPLCIYGTKEVPTPVSTNGHRPDRHAGEAETEHLYGLHLLLL